MKYILLISIILGLSTLSLGSTEFVPHSFPDDLKKVVTDPDTGIDHDVNLLIETELKTLYKKDPAKAEELETIYRRDGDMSAVIDMIMLELKIKTKTNKDYSISKTQ